MPFVYYKKKIGNYKLKKKSPLWCLEFSVIDMRQFLSLLRIISQ